MKQGLVIIIGLVVVAGGAYWYFSMGDMMDDVGTDEQGSAADSVKSGAVETSNYVGLTEAEAEALATANDVRFRVVERDGEPLPTTKDYRPGRINAVVEGDVVTSYAVEGEGSGGEADAQVVHEAIVGATEADAAVLAEEHGVLFRVVEREGEPLAVTEDWRPGRINAVVEGGVVTSFSVEGEDESSATHDKDSHEDPSANKYDLGTSVTPDETGDEAGAAADHDAIIGMTQTEAEAYAEKENVSFRVGAIDGEARPVTMDYRPGRITASLEGGVVTDYSVE